MCNYFIFINMIFLRLLRYKIYKIFKNVDKIFVQIFVIRNYCIKRHFKQEISTFKTFSHSKKILKMILKVWMAIVQ